MSGANLDQLALALEEECFMFVDGGITHVPPSACSALGPEWRHAEVIPTPSWDNDLL